jgi:outer membrane receptor protein involved in Fe transport
MRSLIFTFIALFSVSLAFAQSGAIEGKVYDEETGEGIPFANVALYKGGVLKGGGETNMNGKYSIKPVDPGTYTLKITYVGYQNKEITGIQIAADKTVFQDVPLFKGEKLDEVKVVEYTKPLMEKDETKNQQTLTSDEVKRLPQRDVGDIAASSSGVFQKEEGGGLNFRGGRSNANQVYIDGMKVRGSNAIPQNSIEQISTVTGGIPAEYGDATGGVINITTKGASSKLAGGFEVQTSKFLDPYNHNLFAGNVSGPILTREDEDGNKQSVLGFFVGGEYQYRKDPKPPYTDMYSIKQDVLDTLEQYPLRENEAGTGLVRSSEFLTKDYFPTRRGDTIEDPFTTTPHRQNVQRHDLTLNSKIDYSPSQNIDLTFGGSINYSNYNDFVYPYSLMNPSGNPKRENLNWRVFGRFTQHFKTGGGQQGEEGEEQQESSVIKDAYYTVQLDYEKVKRTEENTDHGNKYFRFGHVGKFNTIQQPFFQSGRDTATGYSSNNVMQGYFNTGIELMEPSRYNPVTARYTEQYYEFFGMPRTKEEIENVGALTNGRRPANIYSLWYNTGRIFNGTGVRANNDQVRFQVDGSADIDISGSGEEENVHSFKFGIEYEQRTDRRYRVHPVSFWVQMRQLANRHITELDKSDPTLIIDGEEYEHDQPHPPFGENDRIVYDRRYVEADQSHFDKALRESLGMPVDGTQWIDIDSLSPSDYSIDMFSADEVLNDGNRLVRYRGYSHTGEKYSSQPTFNDFFTKKDEDGNFTRPIGAYQPIYVAGYIQDKFTFKDLIFNVGLRVDRFDANTKVLKDKYSLYDIHSAEEVQELGGESVEHPGNIEGDYAVYVNDINDPTEIVGYRKGNNWFDDEGEEITNPSAIAQATTTGEISPYLKNPETSIKDEDFNPDNSFVDYDPEVTVMPRVAFSFPISDEATFFAHYDVLTQRPKNRNIAEPYHYYYFRERGTNTTPNPDLKPEKTIDYEVGFKQRLTRSSALSISGFYREMRDMIQIRKIRFAYPNDYVTFDNIDFGTVKGLEFSYDLRRTNNVQLLVNYTLQFAQGTGSSTTSQLSLVDTDNPNIRTLLPLSFDQRHTITTVVDYRFDEGSDYNGPRWFGKNFFENTGANLRLEAGSGTPYSQQSQPTRVAQFGVAQRASLEGSPNGSRLPWTFRADLRVDRQFDVTLGGGEDKPGKDLGVNVYLKVLNLFNNRNVLRVYDYTGTPDDDGYLSSAFGREYSQDRLNPGSFRDLYSIKQQNYVLGGNPHYAMPRRIRIGAEVNF